MKMGWIGIVVLVIAILGILLGLLGISAPDSLSNLSPYALSPNLIIILMIIATVSIYSRLRHNKGEQNIWLFFALSAIFNIVGDILQVTPLVANQTVGVIIFILFVLSYLGLILGLILAIRHMQTGGEGERNIVTPFLISLAVLVIFLIFMVPRITGSETIVGFYKTMYLSFLVLDIFVFILAFTLLWSSFSSKLFAVYGFIAFGGSMITVFHFISFFYAFSNLPLSPHIVILDIASVTIYALGAAVRLQMPANP